MEEAQELLAQDGREALTRGYILLSAHAGAAAAARMIPEVRRACFSAQERFFIALLEDAGAPERQLALVLGVVEDEELLNQLFALLRARCDLRATSAAFEQRRGARL